MGADSLVDRLILGYAVKLLMEQEFFAVFVATGDGGIKIDAAKWRRREDRQLFVIESSKPSETLRSVLVQATQGVRTLQQELRERKARREKNLDLTAKAGIVLVFVIISIIIYLYSKNII